MSSTSQRRTWNEAIIDTLSGIIDAPTDGGELLIFVVIVIVIVIVAGIGAALESYLRPGHLP